MTKTVNMSVRAIGAVWWPTLVHPGQERSLDPASQPPLGDHAQEPHQSVRTATGLSVAEYEIWNIHSYIHNYKRLCLSVSESRYETFHIGPLKILILDYGLEQTKVCDLTLALTWPIFIRFWLGIPQNDQTNSPQKMAYSGSLSDQLIISVKAWHVSPFWAKNSM